MKIVKIFGIVVGIHVFALVLIFANPGCSSSSKPAPAPADTVAKTENPPPPITVPTAPTNIAAAPPPPPLTFNPDAPASAAPSSGGVRFTPTRPNTPAASTLVAEPVADVTPAATYTVKSGDSLWSIANKHKITTTDLAAANNLKTSAVLKLGQKLIIPGKSLPKPTAAAAPAAHETAAHNGESVATKSPAGLRHTVKSGETLGTIAQKYGVKQRDLALANNITDPAKLPAGKELVIPGWDPKAPAPAGKAPTKAAAPAAEARPAFTTPQLDGAAAPVISTAPPPPADVPVIRVDETPAAKKP